MAPVTTDTKGDLSWYELKYNNVTLKYTLGFWGVQPEDGYPLFIALHHGFQTFDLSRNDTLWREFAKK
jgi:hypothetical protein